MICHRNIDLQLELRNPNFLLNVISNLEKKPSEIRGSCLCMCNVYTRVLRLFVTFDLCLGCIFTNLLNLDLMLYTLSLA